MTDPTGDSRQARTPLIAIIGPTAVGKTSLGVRLAERFRGEIISADSRQFYRLMEIGTAKPTPDERRRVHHHLIDIADPDETVGLAQFLQHSREAAQDVTNRGLIPFLVGGTGQYVKAFLQGWQVPEIPPDPDLRARLEAEAAADPDALWQRLVALDPAVVDFIHPHNIRRVVRALEVSLKSGQPFSELRRRIAPHYSILRLGLTMDRTALYARADERVDAMIAAGLPEEVDGLLARGYGWDLPSMSGLGYLQFKSYFDDGATLAEVVERIKLDTHDFIRRQYTWFRPGSSETRWLDVADPATPGTAVELVREHLGCGAVG